MNRSYRVDSVIGENVYRAVHLASSRPVVIVVGEVDDARLHERTAQLTMLNHPGVAPVIEHGELANGRPWISTELPTGLAVDDIVARSPMAADEVTKLIGCIAEVLAHAHGRGVVHGALTLRSVFHASGAFPFAIANWSLGNDRLGAYPAPEGLTGDARGDIYALGVIACRALTQSFPVGGALPALPTDGHADLATLIARMLSVDPTMRPTAAAIRDLAAELGARAAAEVPAELVYLTHRKSAQVAFVRIRKPKWTPTTGTAMDDRRQKVSVVFTNPRAPRRGPAEN